MATPVFKITEKHSLIYSGRICPYCGREPKLMDSSVFYGRSYGPVWACQPCDAYVGVHRGTQIPLGRLANANLRAAKKHAHLYFDIIWQSKLLTRDRAYKWLSSALGTPSEYTHIGMFNVQTCIRVADYSKQLLRQNGITPP